MNSYIEVITWKGMLLTVKGWEYVVLFKRIFI